MAMENKRIIQLSTERTNLTSGDYVMVDSDADGSAKYRLDRLKETDTTLSVSGMAADAAATGQAISDETQARTHAVTAETQARQQAITAESQARQAADTALGNDVSDLKSAFGESELLNNSQKVTGSISPTTSGTRLNSVTNLTFVPGTDYVLKFTSTGLNGQCSLEIRDASGTVKDLGSINTTDTQTKAFTTTELIENAYISHYCYATQGSIDVEITASNANKKSIAGLQSSVNGHNNISEKNAVAYIGDNNMSWSVNQANGVCTLTIGGNLYIKYYDNTITIEKADLLSAASSAGLTVSGDNISGNSFAIYYNLATASIAIANSGLGTYNVATKNAILLFHHHYNSVNAGLLVENYVGTKAPLIERDLANIKTTYPNVLTDCGMLNGQVLSRSVNPTISGNYYYSLTDLHLYPNVLYRLTTYGDSSLNGASSVAIRSSANVTVKSFSTVTAGTMQVNEFMVDEEMTGVRVAHYSYSTAGTIYDRLERVDSLNDIPDFYRSGMDAAIETIRDNMRTAGKHGETFVFITDLHWETNYQNSPRLVKYLLDHLDINTLVCGGDLINQGEPDIMAATMANCVRSFNFKNTFFPCAVGNHDDNSNWSADFIAQHPEYLFGKDGVFALMIKQNGSHVTYLTDDAWNYYFDNTDTQTRFIFLDTGANGTFSHYDELSSCLNGTPSGYHIVIVAHWLKSNGMKTDFDEALETIVDAHNAQANSSIVGVFGGHTHEDDYWSTTGGIKFIITDSDCAERSKNSYTYGTVSEQCFDVVTIDYTAKTIKCVRIGRGSSRNFTY
jgi:hypothetical protein